MVYQYHSLQSIYIKCKGSMLYIYYVQCGLPILLQLSVVPNSRQTRQNFSIELVLLSTDHFNYALFGLNLVLPTTMVPVYSNIDRPYCIY